MFIDNSVKPYGRVADKVMYLILNQDHVGSIPTAPDSAPVVYWLHATLPTSNDEFDSRLAHSGSVA